MKTITDLRDLIEREIEQYLEWPTADKSHVTTVSAKLFAEHVARLYADHIPDAGNMSDPAVHGETVAWSGWGCQYPGKMPRLYGDHRIAELNCDWENGDQVLHFTAAPHPAEQQPTISDEIAARTTFGGPQRFTTAEQQPAPDVDVLVEALETCRDELMWMIERHNQQDQNDGSWLYDYQTVEEADAALAAHRKKKGGGD